MADPQGREAIDDWRLVRSPELEKHTLPDGAWVLKEARRATYMVVTPGREQILELFDGVLTVRQVLRQLLVRLPRPSIREFYDFVLQAKAKGLLQSVDEPMTAALPGHRWSVGVPAKPAIAAAVVCVLVGAGFLWSAPIGLAFSPLDWLWLVIWLSLNFSLANLFGGLVLSGSGCQLYRVGPRWRYGLPYLGIDPRDAILGGRWCEAAVSASMFATPFVLGTAALFAGSSPGMLAAAIAILVYACPLADTPAHRLLFTLTCRHYELPRLGQRFLGRHLFSGFFTARHEHYGGSYPGMYAIFVLLWLTAFVRLGGHLMELNGDLLVEHILAPESSWQLFSATVMLILLVGLLAVPVGIQVRLFVQNAWVLLRERLGLGQQSKTLKTVGETNPEATRRFLRDTLLGCRLDDQLLDELAWAAGEVSLKAHRELVHQGDRQDALYVVCDGAVEIFRESDSGHERLLGVCGPGDMVGEMAVLDRTRRNATVRATKPTSLLAIDQAEYRRLLGGRLADDEIDCLLRVGPLLKRVQLFSDWPTMALADLANEFQLVEIASGTTVIEQGKANSTFYIVYQGHFTVIADDEPVAELEDGDFFGEISLLTDDTAVATVVCRTDSRCLTLDKENFLTFLGSSFTAGYRMETIAQTRLEELDRR